MAWNEKPPILTGRYQADIQNLRDYLFRMANSLTDVITAEVRTVVSGENKGADKTVEDVRRNAEELRSLIVKSAGDLQNRIIENAAALRDEIEAGDAQIIEYTDSKQEIYDSLYLAQSEFGTFEETLTNRIETTARGVVESFDYASLIESTQDSLDLLQAYYETINGEIRRGLVLDPDTSTYVIGIVISQQVTFSGVVDENDPNNPGDGNTYYYVAPNQTFGIYTATGWQFWINGVKRGWFGSQDSMLHVSNIYVESTLQLGPNWEITFSNGFGIKYTGT